MVGGILPGSFSAQWHLFFSAVCTEGLGKSKVGGTGDLEIHGIACGKPHRDADPLHERGLVGRRRRQQGGFIEGAQKQGAAEKLRSSYPDER